MPKHMKPPRSCMKCPFLKTHDIVMWCDVSSSVDPSNFGRPIECPLNAPVVFRGERHA